MAGNNVLDFLFEGSPPPSTTTYGTTTTNVPQWLSDYTQGLINKANSIGASPYQTYDGPRVAGFSPDQQAAQALTRSTVGVSQPQLQEAGALTSAAGGMNPMAYASPYLGAGGKGFNAAWDASGDITGVAQNYFLGANSALDSAISGGGGLAAASPYLQAGTASKWYDVADKYVNPYVDNVITKAKSDARRFYDENMLPEMQNIFTNAGQFGSATMADVFGKRANDLTTRLQENADAARSDAWMKSADIYKSDMDRLIQAGSVAGSAGSADLASRISAARGKADIGATFGDLAAKKASTLLDTAKGYGALGEIAANVATNQGNLQLNAGKQAGALAELAQSIGLRDAAALDTLGAQQQGLWQRNLDTAYSDFLDQRDYDKNNVSWLSNIIRGIDAGKTTTTSATGPGSSYQPSPLAQLASIISATKGWNEATKQP